MSPLAARDTTTTSPAGTTRRRAAFPPGTIRDRSPDRDPRTITEKNGTDVSTASSPATTDYQRWRFRFRKEGDLRWISHRDLVRTWERLCRRAELALRMSEGFHPKPKMSFPSALALGIEGLDEVMELELVTPMDPEELRQRLNALAPAGLIITQAEALGPAARKARVWAMRYQFPVPNERRQQVEQALEQLRASSTLLMNARIGSSRSTSRPISCPWR